MFLTVPEARFPIPPALLSEGETAWSVIRRQLFAPWYIASLLVTEDEHQFTQTLLISHPEWLKVVLSSTKEAEVRKIQRMVYDPHTGGWTSKDVSEVWEEPVGSDGYEPRLALKGPGYEFKFADELDESSEDILSIGTDWMPLYVSADARSS
jgi:hypothetical protein